MDAPAVLLPHHVDREIAHEFAAVLDPAIAGDVIVAETPEESLEAVRTVEAMATWGVADEWLDVAENLRWVQALSAGVDSYDHETLRERDIVLTNASGTHAEPIAEQVLGYMLTFERNLHQSARNQARGVWERVAGGELRGKTVGIVGVGAIGTRTAELAGAFGMEVLGTKRNLDDAPAALDEVYPPDELDELLRRVDYLVLACPLTDETEGLIGTPEFKLLSSDAVVVNIARGDVIDEEALIRALQRGRIGGAALDVFSEEPLPSESPLWNLSNVLITPHMAGSTPHKNGRWRDIIVENYEAFVADELDAMINRII